MDMNDLKSIRLYMSTSMSALARLKIRLSDMGLDKNTATMYLDATEAMKYISQSHLMIDEYIIKTCGGCDDNH